MLEQEFITQAEYNEAQADAVAVYDRIQIANTTYQENLTVNSYFVDEVSKRVMNDLQTELGYTEEQAEICADCMFSELIEYDD
jgi:penicillin-binding protein 1A